MKKRAMITAMLFLGLIGTLVISSCDLVLRQLGELPQKTEEDERKGEKRGRGVPPAPVEEPMASYETQKLERADEAWEPELFMIPAPETGREERKEISPLLFSPEEELWIVVKAPAIEKPHREKAAAFRAVAATGRMERGILPQPRIRTDVKAVINGMISSVTVSQSFRNPQSQHVDIPYQCRLPSNAAVTDFVMTIGERKIRGIVREREEAEEIHELARSRGLLASLVQQEAPNTLRITITNIAPNQHINVSVNYVHTLKFADGAVEFILPLAPAASDPETIAPPAPVDDVRAHQEQTESFAGANGPYEISTEVQIDAGVPIHTISSPTHTIVTEQPTPQQAIVHMRDVYEPGDQEFVIRFGVAGPNPAGVLFAQKRDNHDYFALTLFPPGDMGTTSRVPMDIVFLMDCSKSMKGKPVYRAKQFVNGTLQQLGPSDSFRIVTFAGAVWPTSEHLSSVTNGNLRRASRYVDGLPVCDGEGMIGGLESALATLHNPERLPVLIVITDGYIGNDSEVLSYLEKHVGQKRVFCVGIGTSVNTYLLEDMAMSGRGGLVYLALDDDVTDVASRFIGNVGRPFMTDITVNWGGMEIDEALPRLIPDLFTDRSVLVTGKYRGTLPPTIHISGHAGQSRIAVEIPVNSKEPQIARPGIPIVWARKHISELIRQAIIDPTTDILSLGKQLSVEHCIVSPFASFVIVDTKSGD